MFGPKQPVDGGLVDLILPDPGVSADALKAVAVRESLIADIGRREAIRLLVIDQGLAASSVLVVTDESLVEVKKRKLERRIPWSEFAGVRHVPSKAGGVVIQLVNTEGLAYDFHSEYGYPYRIGLILNSRGAFDEFMRVLDLISAEPTEPSATGPLGVGTPLNPGAFQDVLTEVGLPHSDVNMRRLADVVQAAIAEHIVMAELKARGDDDAADRFARTFYSKYEPGDMDRADKLIAWMLEWQPGYAEEMQGMVSALFAGLTGETSWLRSVGTEIPDPDARTG